MANEFQPLDASNNMEATLSVVKDIAQALNEATDVVDALNNILPRLSEALGLTTAWAFRLDPSRKSFVEVAASGLPPALACNDGAALKTGWCECQDQFMNGRLDTAINIVKCSRLRDAQGDKRNLRYHASIPLRSKGNPLGILNVAAEGHQVFTHEALGLLMTIGNQVAVAVDRAGILTDERQRTRQLQAMSAFAADLVGIIRVPEILDYTVTQFVDNLGYEACGIVMSGVSDRDAKGEIGDDKRLVAAAHQPAEIKSEYQYSYDEEAITECEGLILPVARSVLECRVPQTEYQIRLESQTHRAFRQTDEDILTAFAWHLSAALDNARSYDKSLENAKWLERRRLAAELHDSVSQRLFSAKLLADALQIAGQRQPDKTADGRPAQLLQQLSHLIEDSQREMKTLLETLRPISERGWADRLKERVAHLQLQGSTRFHLVLEVPNDYALSFAVQDCLLKVIDESTHNILRHAEARHAHIHVWLEQGQLCFTIQDDGIGFEPGQVTRGLGTSTMSDRVASAGGDFHLTSQPGNGTTITGCLPCNGNETGRDDE